MISDAMEVCLRVDEFSEERSEMREREAKGGHTWPMDIS